MSVSIHSIWIHSDQLFRGCGYNIDAAQRFHFLLHTDKKWVDILTIGYESIEPSSQYRAFRSKAVRRGSSVHYVVRALIARGYTMVDKWLNLPQLRFFPGAPARRANIIRTLTGRVMSSHFVNKAYAWSDGKVEDRAKECISILRKKV